MFELDYYPLKIAAQKIGCSEEELICLAVEDKLPLFFRMDGAEALILMFETVYDFDCNYGCERPIRIMEEPQFYAIDKPHQIPVETIQRYYNDRDTEMMVFINPDCANKDYLETRLIEPVPLKKIIKYVSAEDVARLSAKELEPTSTANTDNAPIAAKLSKDEQRTEKFRAWITKTKPDLVNMSKSDFQAALVKEDPHLFNSGFNDWWKKQTIHKCEAGRKRA